MNPIVLDTGVLGQIAHPRPHPAVIAWYEGQLLGGAQIVIPEIADFEVRRELLRVGSTRGIARLNALQLVLSYLPITTEIMLQAAELWAAARKRGRPTADPKALDADVILAAQALSVGAIIATENVRHLDQFVDARLWRDIN